MKTVIDKFQVFNPNYTFEYEYIQYESFDEMVKEFGHQNILDVVNANIKRHTREEKRNKFVRRISPK